MFRSLILLFFVTACMPPKTHYPNVSSDEIHREAERQNRFVTEQRIQKREKAERKRLEQQERLVKVSSNVLRGGSELCGKISAPGGGCFYGFKLEQSNKLNAYADGDTIYITSKMMNFAKEDEELAAILAHEYAHNLMGHIGASATNSMIGSIIGVAFDTIASTQGLETGSTFSQLGGKAGSLTFSKGYEKEADYIGMYIASIAGYDISKIPDMWRRMSIKDPDSIFVGNTHPTNPERYIALEKTVAEIRHKKMTGLAVFPELN